MLNKIFFRKNLDPYIFNHEPNFKYLMAFALAALSVTFTSIIVLASFIMWEFPTWEGIRVCVILLGMGYISYLLWPRTCDV